jgi:hypothetical protein
VIEVHAADPGDERGHRRDRDPRRDAPRVLVLADADLREVGLEDAGQQVPVGVDLVIDAAGVVLASRRYSASGAVSTGTGFADQLIERLDQPSGRAMKRQHLALEPVDAVGFPPSALNTSSATCSTSRSRSVAIGR